jgi:hypothetical protein
VDRNPGGFNQLVDETLEAGFGDNFENIVKRVNTLAARKSSIHLDARYLEATGLGAYLHETDEFGWSELNLLVSTLRMAKAALQLLAAYDLDTSLSFLQFAWKDETANAAFLQKLADTPSAALPFNNTFLKKRTANMPSATDNTIKAAEGIMASVKEISNKTYYPEWISGSTAVLYEGFGLLRDAVLRGKVFYAPKDFSAKWPSKWDETARFSVDMTKLFGEGFLSLDNIFETEGGKPVFYAGASKLKPDNYAAELTAAGGASLKLTAQLAALFPETETAWYDILASVFPSDWAKILFELYYLGGPQP